MAYIDLMKADYSGQPEDIKKESIIRDKKNLAMIIQEKIAKDIDNIVDRWYELEEIGIVNINEKFLDLLKEAEQLYSFGYYTGTVAVSGIAAEEYTKYLYQLNIGGNDSLTQERRINLLAANQKIDDDLKNNLHEIRKIRNECMHYNQSFKTLPVTDLKGKAKEIIDKYKKVLSPIVDNTDVDEKVLVMASISAKDSYYDSARTFTMRYRNLLLKQGINLQMPPNVKNEVRQSIYHVSEIDISTDCFKEMTLVDVLDGGIVVVDLTLPQADSLSEREIKEGNLIAATVMSSVDGAGITSEWTLVCIDDVCRCNLNLDDLERVLK